MKRVEDEPFDPNVAVFWSTPTFEEWRDWMVAQDRQPAISAALTQLAAETKAWTERVRHETRGR